MADPNPLSLSVFSTDATAPVPETPAPVSPVAEQGPVAPPTEYTTQTNENFDAAAAQTKAEADPNRRSTFRLWADSDSSVAAMIRMGQSAGFMPDMSYRLPDADSTAGKQLYRDIPDDFLNRFTLADSAEHAEHIGDQIRTELNDEKEWQTHSGWGRLGLGLVDPVNLGLMLTGAGEVQSASRVARFLKGGATAAMQNAAITTFLDSGKQTASGHDIAWAAASGWILGGSLHALPSAEAIRANNAANAVRRELALNELTDRVEKGEIPEDQVRPEVLAEVKARQAADQLEADRAHANAQVSNVDRQVTEHLANEETRLKGITEGEDGQAVAVRNDFDQRSADLQNAKAILDEHSEILSRDREVQVKEEAQRLAEADEKNAYAQKRNAEGGSPEKPVFEKWTEQAQENVERTRANSAKLAEQARGVIAKAQTDVDRVNRVRAAESDLEQLRNTQKGAKTVEERLDAVSHAPLRERLGRQLKSARDEQARVEASPKVAADVSPEAAPTAPGMAGGFGEDSASAARANDIVAPAVEINTKATPVPRSSDAIKVVNRGPFKTFSSVLRGSTNAIVRSRLGRMFGEAVASHDGESNTVGASDHMAILSHSWNTRASQADYANKYNWMREQGYNGFWNKYSPTVQKEWATAVGKAIRGIETNSKPVQAAAKQYATLYRDMLKAAKESGVKGFENIEENEHYLPRSFDFDRLKEMNRLMGDNGMANFLADAMERGMRDVGPLDRDALTAIAKGYLARSKRLGLGVDNAMLNSIKLDDFEYIRGLLSEGTTDTAAVDRIIDSLKAKAYASADRAGATRYAKYRVRFDETHMTQVPNEEGKMVNVSLADMWNNDAGQLTQRYIRTMSGHTALAKVGIRSEADFQQSLAEALSSLEEHGATKEESDLVRAYGDGGYKLITGRPLDNEAYGLFQKAASVARDYAYTRSMNQSGFSIANNLIRPWTNGYAKYTAKYMPAMAELFKRGKDGELSGSLMREIERFTGIGADSVNMQIWNHYEADSLLGKALGATSQGLKIAGRVTSHISGMTPGLVFGQRLMSVGILDRLVRNAFGEATVPAKRLAIMGLDDSMMGRIKAQLLEHAPETQVSGQKIRAVNWANWTDLEARDAMLAAIHRETRILIHGEDVASTGLWMNKWWGRLFIQMRRFPMMAMSKQLGRAMHMRDLDTVVDFMLTGTVGTASFAAQTYLRSLGMDESDKQKFLDKNLSWGRLVAAGIQRNPYSGMAPQLIDTLAARTVGTPVFDARGSGLSTDLFSGTPVVDAVSKLSSTLSDPIEAGLTGKRYTQKEWKALTSAMPLGNSFPMVWLTNAMASNFAKQQMSHGKKETGSVLDQAFDE